MKVVVTADFHGHLPPDGAVRECDLLILAGDVLPHQSSGMGEFADWLRRQPAKAIVGIAGNHDFIAEDEPNVVRALPWTYLQDETIDLEIDGETVRVWGSPRSNRFNDWAFMADDDELAEVWKGIPDDVEILVTHGPAYGLLDVVNRSKQSVGSTSLRRRLEELTELKLFAFGHIHEGYGITAYPRLDEVEGGGPIKWTAAVNGAYVDDRYRPGNEPIPIDLAAGYASTESAAPA